MDRATATPSIPNTALNAAKDSLFANQEAASDRLHPIEYSYALNSSIMQLIIVLMSRAANPVLGMSWLQPSAELGLEVTEAG